MSAFAETAPTESGGNVWRTSLFAGLVTAIIAVATSFAFRAETPLYYLPVFLLIGAGPVLGYQFAKGRFGSNWGAVIGGIIGFILLFIGWPILVGAFSREQSIGRLLLASIVGFILGVIAFFILATAIGQNPGWVGTGFVFLCAMWGGTVGAMMDA